MKERANTEKLYDIHEEQLQAITGAGDPNPSSPKNDAINLHDELLDHHIHGALSHALGNISDSDQHNEQANATMERIKSLYIKENNQKITSPVASPKKSGLGCFPCFGRK